MGILILKSTLQLEPNQCTTGIVLITGQLPQIGVANIRRGTDVATLLECLRTFCNTSVVLQCCKLSNGVMDVVYANQFRVIIPLGKSKSSSYEISPT